MGRKRILRVVSWLLILSMVFLDLPANTIRIAAAPNDATIQVLDASVLTKGEITEDFTENGFTIKAISGKKVTVDSNEKTSEYNHSFSQRLKMGGAGDAAYRCINFTTSTEGAIVTIYALSSSTDTRTMQIFDENGTSVASGLEALGEASVPDAEGKIPAIKVTLGAAGTYSIRPDKSINIYYVSVCEGTDAEADFSEGITPSVKGVDKNDLDENLLDVTVSGTIANADTDRLWVKMYDESGKLVDSAKVSALTNGEATVKLTPGDIGTYSFVCEAIRGGSKTTYKSATFPYSFVPGLTEVKISSVLTNGEGGLDVTWRQAVSAVSYDVSVAAKGTDEFIDVKTGISFTTDSYTVSIPNTLVSVGSTYTIKVTAYDEKGKSVAAATDKKVKDSIERFKTALVGSGASGTFDIDEDTNTVTMTAAGSGSGGKLADSEDGFLYYYTEIDPEKENFTLTADFKVIDSQSKDNQSGFGVMAIDDFVDGDTSARYFNSAGCMVRKYSKIVDGNIENLYGSPGGYFVTGYTGKTTVSSPARKLIDTAPFDWNWKAGYTTATSTNPPKFEDGETYTLTLKKDNTGFHAIMGDYDEIICYEPDLLLQQNGDKYYVGVVVSRKITIAVSDILFTTSDPASDEPGESRPDTTVSATVSYDSASTASSSDFEAAFKANYVGTIDIYNAANKLVASGMKVDPRNEDTFRITSMLQLTEGSNRFRAVYTPAEDSEQGDLLAATENLDQTPITVDFTVTYKQYGTSDNAIYVSANGSPSNKGTKASPLDVYTAVAYAQPGQEIVLLEGTYNLTKKIEVERGHNGTAAQPITIMSEPDTRVKLNLANSVSGGFVLNGDYWHIYDFEIYNGRGNQKVVQVTGNNNTVEKVTVHDNGYTGIQVSGNAAEPFSMWPANNLILSCESYNNCDPLANDADGFAAKLTVGEGNVFRYCISHNNIDDGWDLYAKSTTGLIGEVTVDQCVAYDNGHLTADSGNTAIGEGNGFKLGGESIPVAHKLVNSVSFNNLKNGVFSNSNPNCRISNVTSYQNGGQNLQLNTNAATTTWSLSNYISYGKAGSADSMDLREQDSLLSSTNYLDGKNMTGASVTDDWFVNLDTSVLPAIAEDGSINMHGLLELTSAAANGVGAVISANPNPTVIEVGKEIGTSETPTPSITPSVAPTPSIAPSVVPTPSITPSVVPTPSITPSVVPTPSITPSVVPTPSIAPSVVPTPSITPSVVPTPEVSVSPSPSPSQTTSVAKPVFTKNLDSSVSYTYATGDKAVKLSVSAAGKSLTYQWYYNTSARYSGATKISGATGKTYTPSTTKVYDRYYFVKVTSHDNSKDIKTAAVNSNRVKVVVKKVLTKAARPSITLNLLKNSNGTMKTYSYYTGGKATTLKVAATGKKITYQWYRNTTASYAGAAKIAGAASAAYKPSTTTKGTNYYFVKIYNTDNTKDIKRVTGYSRIVKVTVKKAVTSIKCDNITVKAGKTKKLTVTVLPTSASNKKVTYKSSNTKYAAVSSTGVVTARKAGKGKTVTITITSSDNSKVVKKVKVTIQ